MRTTPNFRTRICCRQMWRQQESKCLTHLEPITPRYTNNQGTQTTVKNILIRTKVHKKVLLLGPTFREYQKYPYSKKLILDFEFFYCYFSDSCICILKVSIFLRCLFHCFVCEGLRSMVTMGEVIHPACCHRLAYPSHPQHTFPTANTTQISPG